MTTVYNLKLEPLEERYTAQWERWFHDHFDEEFEGHVEIDGEPLVEGEIENGAFLDLYSTTHYKDSQLKEMAKLFHEGHVEDGDKIFVADFWYPGVESLKYMADLSDTDVEMYGFLHAGSYTEEDFAQAMEGWAEYQEIAWANMYDGIFVGSPHSKERFIDRRVEPYATDDDAEEIKDKIHVTGNPFDIDGSFERLENETQGVPEEKQDKIIFPNRFDFEKRPNRFLNLVDVLNDRYGDDVDIVITTSRPELERSDDDWLVETARAKEKKGELEIKDGISKSKYYKELAESKVMVTTTIEENFGYVNVESLAFNTVPVMPNNFSHPFIVQGDDQYLYDDLDEALELIDEGLDTHYTPGEKGTFMKQYAKEFDSDKVIQDMVEVMKNAR
jgi:hypothetical protein